MDLLDLKLTLFGHKVNVAFCFGWVETEMCMNNLYTSFHDCKYTPSSDSDDFYVPYDN